MCLLVGASAGSGKGETDAGKQLLLAYLADRHHGDTALSSAAMEFMLCQSFASAAAQCQKTEGGEEEQAALLVDYRMQLTSLRRPAASPLTESEDFRLFILRPCYFLEAVQTFEGGIGHHGRYTL